MELTCNENGDPASELMRAMSGRRLLLDQSAVGPHLFQTIPARWRAVNDSLKQLIDEVEQLRYALNPEGLGAADALRRLIYDATELFDVYCQLFPKQFGSIISKGDLKTFTGAAKRMRDPWALICNKCKHSGSQMVSVWAVSRVNAAACPMYMVCSYKDGDALVRDDEVHRGKRGGVCIVMSARELIHSLLRVDLQAAKLARGAKDAPDAPLLPETDGVIQLGQQLLRLSKLPARCFSDQSASFDDFRLAYGSLELRKSQAQRLIDPVGVSTHFRGDGITRTFSFA